MKRDSLTFCGVQLPWTSPGQPGLIAGDERARRELVLLAQCESHIRAEDRRKKRRDLGSSAALGCSGFRKDPQFCLLWEMVLHHPPNGL